MGKQYKKVRKRRRRKLYLDRVRVQKKVDRVKAQKKKAAAG